MEKANSDFISNLITNTETEDYIQTLFNKEIKSIQILYADTEENLSDANFYENCVDKGNLFFITKSSSDKIFGGYLPNGLKSSQGHRNYYQEGESFLFSLDNKQKLKCINESKSVQHFNGCFPTFGVGSYPDSDLSIDLKGGYGSFSNLGKCYELPTGFEGEANCFLAGSEEFNLVELEVYMIHFE